MEETEMKKYDLRKIMKKAWTLVKEVGMSISSALKISWKEAKNMANEIKNVVVRHFYTYNANRYSTPWVCEMKEDGTYDFSKRIGTYTANKGEEGDLIVFSPVVGQVYGWGQRDYRGSNTEKNWIKWNGEIFVPCDKLGNEK